MTIPGLAQPSLEMVQCGLVHPVVLLTYCVTPVSLGLLWALVFPPGITKPAFQYP